MFNTLIHSHPHSPVDTKRRQQPVGAETRPKYSDTSSSSSSHQQYNGLVKRNSLTSDALPVVVRGSHGTVTLGSRRSSTDAISMATRDLCVVEGIGNGRAPSGSSKYSLPPIV